jgi:hypothetical protein
MQKPAARNFYKRYQPSMEVVLGALFIGALFILFGARLLAREWAGW